MRRVLLFMSVILPVLLIIMVFKYSVSVAESSERDLDIKILRAQFDYVAKHKCTISPASGQWWVCSSPKPHHIFIRDERVNDETSIEVISEKIQ